MFGVGVVIIPQSYGGDSEGETPGPIPNPEAKPFSADGTAPATVWESRTPPDTIPQGRSLANPTANDLPRAYLHVQKNADACRGQRRDQFTLLSPSLY